ncbi:MAG: leucine-rich repeat domain-containing protein [Promethearchaeota archaeon]|jgi:Leucine-rich repeat (LRR) protein
MKEFRINNFITLRLEGQETVIYVANKRYMQCKYLLMIISAEEIQFYEDIESIDDVINKLDNYTIHRKGERSEIPPETEFWGHCSNLQAWYENKYDTRILLSSLAFPLLKKLADAGDPLANNVFKNEIAKRISSNNISVITFLVEIDYLLYLDREEVETIFHNLSDEVKERIKKIYFEKFQKAQDDNEKQESYFEILEVLCEETEISKIQHVIHKGKKYFVNDGYLKIIEPKDLESIEDIKNFKSLKGLKKLFLGGNNINKICCLDNFLQLEELYLGGNQITQIKSLDNLINLEVLNLGSNQISEINGLDKLINLKVLDLDYNEISDIGGLDNVTNLKSLSLSGNRISEIKGLDNLKKLKYLSLDSNQIKKIEGLEKVENLRNLFLDHNQITEIQGLEKVPLLGILSLNGNQIRVLKGLEEQINLIFLHLIDNPIEKVEMQDLYMLQSLITVFDETIHDDLKLLIIEQCVKLEPGNAEILNLYIDELKRIRKIPELLEKFKKLVEDHPKIPILWTKLGHLYYKVGERYNALQAYKEGLLLYRFNYEALEGIKTLINDSRNYYFSVVQSWLEEIPDWIKKKIGM